MTQQVSPLVSIIIPCFNGEAYVADAIRSALAQTYASREVIVVDDGSTDGSLDIIRSFGDQVRALAEPHRGGSAARNRGLAAARGEYIQFLDADDVLYPDKLAVQVPLLSGSDCDVVFCAWDWQDRDQGTITPYRHPLAGEDPFLYVLTNHLQTSSGLYRTPVLQRIGGFSEDLPCAQEFDLHVRLTLNGLRCGYTDRALFLFRKSASGVSGNLPRIAEYRNRVLRKAFDLLCGQTPADERRLTGLQDAAIQSGRAAMKWGAKTQATAAFELAREICPRRRNPSSGAECVFTRVFGLVTGLTLFETLRLWKTRGRAIFVRPAAPR